MCYNLQVESRNSQAGDFYRHPLTTSYWLWVKAHGDENRPSEFRDSRLATSPWAFIVYAD